MFSYKIVKKAEDKERVLRFIEENGFDVPQDGVFLLAEDDGGEVVGVGVLQLNLMLEPFIAKNPMVAHRLFYNIEGIAQLNNNQIFCMIGENKDLNNLMEKLGYEELKVRVWRKKWD